HFSALGRSLQNLNLMTTKSWQEIVHLVSEKTDLTASGIWIEGRGWHQEKWLSPPGRNVNGYPYHDALSAVSPDNPVILYHASGHGLFANAKAMELAGISRETPNPVGGRIVRDAQGNLTGMFEENAMDLLNRPYTAWKNQQPEAKRVAAFERTIALATQECLAKGITSFQDAGSDFWELAQYRRLAESGQLGLRLWAMVMQPKAGDFPKLAQFPQIGLGEGFFTCQAVKAYLDGALGSYGAWLLAPYTDKPDTYGQNTSPVDTIAALAAECRRRHLQYCVHAIGDRANREVLNVFEQAFRQYPGTADELQKFGFQTDEGHPGFRWRIEHAQHTDPADQARFAQLGVIASMQAIHCTSDAPFVVKRLGLARAQAGAYAWRRLLDQGARLTNGTDAPVEDVDPLPCLYAAVTRRRADGGAPFFPENCLTREEALLSYTRWNAYAAFEETVKGSLEVGKYADLVVLSIDLLRCVPEEILQAKVLKTYVHGQLKFSR
ncbi:MAG: amidohydrolase, partial [Saprospiraceae bacterium]